ARRTPACGTDAFALIGCSWAFSGAEVMVLSPNADRREVTIPASGGQSEAARLEALLGYRILDTPPEQDFDDLVELAAAVCNTPVAAIAFVDGHRSWLKAKRGVEVWELPRDTALSAEALLHTDVFEVSDARKDVRYQSSQV